MTNGRSISTSSLNIRTSTSSTERKFSILDNRHKMMPIEWSSSHKQYCRSLQWAWSVVTRGN